MNMIDLQKLLNDIMVSGIGGPYASAYLAFGFLHGSLEDEEVRQDFVDYMRLNPKYLSKLVELRDDLNKIMAESDNANS